MVIAFLFLFLCVVVISMLTYIRKNREYLVEKLLPGFLKNLVPSDSVLEMMILVNKIAFMLFIAVFAIGFHFLYMNPRYWNSLSEILE